MIAKGVGHEEDSRYFRVMMDFVHNGTVTDIYDYGEASIARKMTRTTVILIWLAGIAAVIFVVACIYGYKYHREKFCSVVTCSCCCCCKKDKENVYQVAKGPDLYEENVDSSISSKKLVGPKDDENSK